MNPLSLFKKILNKKKNKSHSYTDDIRNIISNECDFYEKKINKLGVDGVIKLLPSNVVEYIKELENQVKNMDKNKKNLLVIDDNPGLLSLINDILELSSLKDNLNVVFIQSSYAGFIYKILSMKYNIKFDYAIIDITFGGIIVDANDGNIKYEGIMVFKDLISKNKNIKYIFYTGNSLNKYVYNSKKIIELFNIITNDDILKHVVYKNQYPPSKLIEIIKNLLRG